jgi:hypothetical protein
MEFVKGLAIILIALFFFFIVLGFMRVGNSAGGSAGS